ncbi:MAG TPA: glycosyltransferase family 4 protein [Vicinamibacteria bacterium]
MTADTAGAVWTYALELAGALAGHGVSVALATMGRLPDDEQRAEAGRIRNLKLYESAFLQEWMEDPWPDVTAAGEWLLELRDLLQPDLVHLNGYAHAALPWRRPVVVAAHFCMLSRWTALHGGTPPPAWGRYRSQVQRGLLAADVVVAPNRAMLEVVEHHHGPLACGRVVPNGRDHCLFLPRAKQPYILAAGRRWDEAKNLAALDEAARTVEWPVFLAGEPLGPSPSASEVATHYTHPLGYLPPRLLAAWLGRAAIYALPARYEPFGLSVLEAALSGCALVLGDIPTLRELWDETALFVHPDDTAGLARALRILCADATLRTRLAQRSRARALELSPERMAQGYLEAYVLAGRSAAARNVFA